MQVDVSIIVEQLRIKSYSMKFWTCC